MQKTKREIRESYTDKINKTNNWKDILNIKDDEGFIKPLYMNNLIDNIPDNNHENLMILTDEERFEQQKNYEELCDIIDNLLSRKELEIFSLIVDEGYSLRKIAEDKNISHETVRRIYNIACLKIKEAIQGIDRYKEK